MRVTAFLFNPPGRGEFLSKSFDMPDSAMPSTPADFALRSIRAVKFFWPQASTGKALTLDECDQCNTVHGAHWQVSWATDAHIASMEGFVEKHYAKCSTLNDLFKAAALIQPNRSITL